MFNTGTMPMADKNVMKIRRRLFAVALVIVGAAAFALAQRSHGVMEMASWFIVAFCAGGLVSRFQRPRPS